MATVTSVNISEKKGVRKNRVDEIVLKREVGIEGDAHAGNWHRQISLLAEESVDKAKQIIPGLTPGAFAENINTRGMELFTLPVGTRLKIGSALTEVTQIGKQCHDSGCAIKKATGDCVMPREGIFVQVLEDGTVKSGDEITIIE
ncbi:MOSC domain-containing protein [Parasporobacterium paucivorans]|uniref:MOSC domain-containing protein n=1 Tax=Parasporobacterium paucivorans DSM 15970 TaxID=1122934 RepID=A0A1M6E6Q1_9FIRM|nr:MOSC domain-containing protein [Parasporobacterium paucivorans]SHI81083.1 MOSC domain-containing protein [Parasporobacterium paucivorans DSM 15970]